METNKPVEREANRSENHIQIKSMKDARRRGYRLRIKKSTVSSNINSILNNKYVSAAFSLLISVLSGSAGFVLLGFLKNKWDEAWIWLCLITFLLAIIGKPILKRRYKIYEASILVAYYFILSITSIILYYLLQKVCREYNETDIYYNWEESFMPKE